jgi:hypothetical protein
MVLILKEEGRRADGINEEALMATAANRGSCRS